MSIDNSLRKIDRQKLFKASREAYGEKPLDVHAQNVVRTGYYKDYLTRLVYGTWEVSVDVAGWNLDFLRACLFKLGGFAVASYKGAIVMFPFSVQTRTIQHLPLEISSNDGDIQITRGIVGESCEIVTLGYKDITCTMWSYSDIIDIYAQKLSNCDASIDINLQNCKAPFLFECNDRFEAEDMRALYTRINNGEPAVYWRRNKKNLLDESKPLITTLPIKENYIVGDVMDAKRGIIAEFLSAVGVNNVDYEKRERLVTAEATANNDMLTSVMALWKENVNACVDKVNSMFDVGLRITYKGGDSGDSARPVRGISNSEL